MLFYFADCAMFSNTKINGPFIHLFWIEESTGVGPKEKLPNRISS